MGIPILERKDGTLEVDNEVRRILRAVIKAAKTPSRKKQKEIALALTGELGRTVEPYMLADFTRNGTRRRQVRFPASFVPAFCKVTGNEALQLYVLSPEQRTALELGRRHSEFAWVFGKLKRELEQILRSQGRAGKAKRAR